MDPAGLLLSVATVFATIDRIQDTYNATSSALSSIRSQIKILETGLRQIQTWTACTDANSKAQVMDSLQDAMETVHAPIYRLQEELDSITRTGPKTTQLLGRTRSDQWVKTKFALNEARLKKHLTDVRESVSLIHFTLAVCQLPVGRDAERQVEELGLGAKVLSRAQSSRRTERQLVIREQAPENNSDHSADFNTFVNSLLDAEEELMQSSGSISPPVSQPSWDSTNGDRGELQYPEENGSAFLSDSKRPERPPKVPEYGHIPDAVQPQRQVSRKPVRQISVSAASVLSDATLNTSPTTENGTYTSSLNGFQPLQPSLSKRMRRPGFQPSGSSNTNVLFNQASRSLGSLADDFGTTSIHEDTESPPPYANGPASLPIRDIKRRDTQSTTFTSRVETAAIVQVVRENRLELLSDMLENGVEIDEVDPVTKRTAIMEAAYLRRTKMSQILIRCGSRLHLKDVDGNTALHFAASNGDADTCVRLLHAGAQLNEYNRSGDGPMDLAARGGHTETVICLLNTWASQNGHATTLLKGFLESVKSGNASTAHAFIERGVKPSKMKEPYKPMAYAAMSGSNPMVDLLLAEKCSLKDRSPGGWTALHFAAHAGHTAMVEKLLAWKIPWKQETKKGETALHLASLEGHTSTALALILHKDAKISMKDNDDQQAIHHAVRNGDIQLTAALLNRGAKLDVHNKYGWYPIHLAAAYGHLPLVAEFITRGANVDEVLNFPSFNSSKKTNEGARHGYWCEIRWPHGAARPLHLALEFGHDDVANTLMASGAKIEEVDSKGWRPLHYAAWNCRSQMVELLLSRGASPHATTVEGNTPYSLGFREPGLMASYEEKERVCEILNAAMNARKKSKIQKLTKLVEVGRNKTRDVRDRNKAWHTAELAAALYQSGQLGDGESEVDLQLAPSISSYSRESVDVLESTNTKTTD